jgi:hypothetical protein
MVNTLQNLRLFKNFQFNPKSLATMYFGFIKDSPFISLSLNLDLKEYFSSENFVRLLLLPLTLIKHFGFDFIILNPFNFLFRFILWKLPLSKLIFFLKSGKGPNHIFAEAFLI